MPSAKGLRQFFSGTRNDASAKPPVLLSWRSSKFFIVMTVSLALFTDIFYYALIVPVIPFSLTVQVGLAEDQVQRWTSILLACYSAALFVGSPIAGIYADHTSSRRWPLLLGLLALAASTLLLCFGKNIALLVVGRLLQGFSAAIVWSVGCALLVDTMENAVGVAMGYVAMAMSFALLIAPSVGGAVYAAAGYYSVYYIAFGVVLVDILLRLLMIEKKVAKQWEAQVISLTATNPGQVSDKGAVGGLQSVPQPDAQPMMIEEPTIGETAAASTNRASPATDEVSSPQQRKPRRPVWILLRSPRLLAALYAILTQAGIMYGSIEWKSVIHVLMCTGWALTPFLLFSSSRRLIGILLPLD